MAKKDQFEIGAIKRDGSRGTVTGRFITFAERWFPDAYTFVLVAVVLVAGAAIVHGAEPLATAQAFGDGFWNLLPFTTQMALVAIGGYVVATSPPAQIALRRLARVPSSGRSAIVMVGVLSIALSLLNWGLSLILSGLLVRAIARRDDIRLDYCAAGAAAYLGLGCGFTLGLSSSAAQLQANAESMPPAMLLAITGVITFSQTIFTWQNGVMVLLVTLVSGVICYCTAPRDGDAKTAESLGVSLAPREAQPAGPRRPGELLDRSPVLTILVVLLALGWLAAEFAKVDPVLSISSLNTYNFVFLFLGLLLHWRPRNLVRAFQDGVPAVGGILLQFPFYAGLANILTHASNAAGTTLSETLAQLFVRSSVDTGVFAWLVGAYSALLGLFIPSAGGKWIVEAPYVMAAANEVQAHLGWTVMVYNIAETLPNFINPFWMLPLLGLLGLRSKDLVGYTSIQFVFHLPIVLFAAAVLMATFDYSPPVHP